MDLLEQLGVALGLASLAGVNLYLTVLLTGVLVRFDWLHLADKYQHLDVFGHPVVLAVTGVLFVMEFFADKIPWVDSLWDSVHTIIRPVGGTLVALQVLGQMEPWMQIVAGLVAGTAALTTHSAKAGTRLMINHSPEPFSNVAMSLSENIAVAGASIFVLMKPLIALGVFSAIIIVIWMIFPRIFRVIRTSLWLIWNKLRMPGRRESLKAPIELPKELNGDILTLLATQANTSEHEVAWTAPCITGKGKGIKGLKGNFKAVIVAKNESKTLLLAVMGGLRDRLFDVPLADSRIDVDSRFLSENLMIESAGKTVVLRFPRGQTDLVETVAMRLRQMAGPAVPSIAEVEPVKEDMAPMPSV
jgi:hypothetical protein